MPLVKAFSKWKTIQWHHVKKRKIMKVIPGINTWYSGSVLINCDLLYKLNVPETYWAFNFHENYVK